MDEIGIDMAPEFPKPLTDEVVPAARDDVAQRVRSLLGTFTPSAPA
jgi:hypothetical protein